MSGNRPDYFIAGIDASSVCCQEFYDHMGGDREAIRRLAEKLAEGLLREPGLVITEVRSGQVFTSVRLQIVLDKPLLYNGHPCCAVDIKPWRP